MNKSIVLLIIVAFIVGGVLAGRIDISRLLPFAIILICPLMMMFMMKDHHKHK